MQTQKLNLLDFKKNELRREDISSFRAGAPVNGPTNPPKPGGNTVGNGAGGGQVCYYDVEGTLLYCESREPDPVKGGNPLIP